MIPLVPETKMADIGKLTSLGNLLARKVTFFVLTTTSTSLILSRAFGADRMTRIAYIYSRLPRTHSLLLSHFNIHRQHTHTLSLSLSFSLSHTHTFWLQRQHTHTLSLSHTHILTSETTHTHSLSLCLFTSTTRNSLTLPVSKTTQYT